MLIINLCDDVLDIIYNINNIKCHVCNLKYKFNKKFYKKQGKFYYCSKQCYNFIS